jgi:hypothetical protein
MLEREGKRGFKTVKVSDIFFSPIFLGVKKLFFKWINLALGLFPCLDKGPTTPSIMTFSITTFNITTFSILTNSIKGLFSIHCGAIMLYRVLFIGMLNAIVLSVVVLYVVMWLF